MENQAIPQLNQFRQELYQAFDARADATMNLVDALCSNTNARSVAELSLSSFFLHSYNSLYDAIDSFFQVSEPAKGREERQAQDQKYIGLIAGYLPKPLQRKFWLLAQDATTWPRPYAVTLPERGFVYQPSLIQGNKPVIPGHQYSALVVLPELREAQAGIWTVPMVLRRILLAETETQVGADVLNAIVKNTRLPFHKELTVDVVDAKYGVVTFLAKVADNDNLIVIPRSRSNRVYYRSFVPSPHKSRSKGHPTWYGERFELKAPETWGVPDGAVQTTYTSKQGRTYTVAIEAWDNLLMRGKRDLPRHDKPFTLVRVRFLDAAGQPVFKRTLWLIVLGQRRSELSLLEIWQAYQRRYDIEHFFRFGKQRLLLDKYQTPDAEREENWAQIVKLAYVQLWLMRSLVDSLLRPWEKYLPQVKGGLASPSRTRRDAERIIRQIGTPAQAPKPRGKSPGRQPGTKMPRRERLPVVKKAKKSQKTPKAA